MGSKRLREMMLCAVLGTASSTALAQPDSGGDIQACAASYEQAQISRKQGKLKGARDELVVCVRESCPDFVRTDCAQWLTEVNAEIPSVIFAAVGSKKNDLVDVKVSLNGVVLTESLDGRAIEIDPGQYDVLFEHAGKQVKRTLVVHQGEKNRVIRVEIETEVDSDADGIFDSSDDCPLEAGTQATRGCPVKEAPPPVVVDEGPNMMRIGAYASWGAGAAGFATFAIFLSMARSEEDEAREICGASGEDCTPEQKQDRLDDVKSKLLVGNIGLGVGIAGAAAGAVLYYLSMEKENEAVDDETVRFDLHPTSHGGMLSVGGSF